MANVWNEDFDFGRRYPEYLYRENFILKNRMLGPKQTEIILPSCEMDIFFSHKEYEKYKERSLKLMVCQFSVLDKLSAPISSEYMAAQLSLLMPEES